MARGRIHIAWRAHARGDVRQRDAFAIQRMLAVVKRIHSLSDHLHGNHSLVIGQHHAVAKFIQICLNIWSTIARGVSLSYLVSSRCTRGRPKVFFGAVQLIFDAVGKQQHRVAGFRLKADFVVGLMFQQPDRHAFGLRP